MIYRLELTREQLETIKTALCREAERYPLDSTAAPLIRDALEAVNRYHVQKGGTGKCSFCLSC